MASSSISLVLEGPEASARDEDVINGDADNLNDIETVEQHHNNRNTSIRRPIKPVTSYAIPLTRRNVTRIPVAKPIRWDKQEPPTAAPDQSIPLPKIATVGCVMGSLLVTLLAWSLAAVVTIVYAFIVWNSILFLFQEGRFYDWSQENNTVILQVE